MSFCLKAMTVCLPPICLSAICYVETSNLGNFDDNYLDKMCRYYPQIDVCQSEKDGDIAAKKKELELAAEEDFGNSRV